MAEKQKIIFRELENIRATEDDEHVPGYEFIKLYTGRTIGRFLAVPLNLSDCISVNKILPFLHFEAVFISKTVNFFQNIFQCKSMKKHTLLLDSLISGLLIA